MKQLTKKQLFEAFVKETTKQAIKEACMETKKQNEDLDPNKVVHEALYEDEASMAEVEESENKRIEFDIPYEAYNILTQYWYGQGDPLYAVLSRSEGDKVNANDAELSRLISAAEQALEDLEKSNEIYSEDDYISLAVFLEAANKAYTALTGYDGYGLVGEAIKPKMKKAPKCKKCGDTGSYINKSKEDKGTFSYGKEIYCQCPVGEKDKIANYWAGYRELV